MNDDATAALLAPHPARRDSASKASSACSPSRALVIGAGGLGSPVALYLGTAGVGRLTIVDDDAVDLTNLQRQIAHNLSRIGQPKVDSARADRAGDQPRAATSSRSRERADAAALAQLVADGRRRARLQRQLRDPPRRQRGLRRGRHAAGRRRGDRLRRPDLGLRHAARPTRPCYACLFPPDARRSRRRAARRWACSRRWSASSAAMQAAEALKLLAGVGTSLAGRLQMLDARTMELDRDPRRARPRLPGVRRARQRTRVSARRERLNLAHHGPTQSNDLERPQLSAARSEDAAGREPPSRYDGPESAYRLAFTDTDFLLREELRPVRMQLELLKPETGAGRAGHRVDDRASSAAPASRRPTSRSELLADARSERRRRARSARAEMRARDEPLLRRGAALRGDRHDRVAPPRRRRSTSSPAAAPASWRPATAARSRSAARASA